MATLKEDVIIVAGIGLGLALIAYYLKVQGGKVLDSAIETVADNIKYVDPTSSDNLAYQGASAFTRLITGRNGDLGSMMYDIFNPKITPESIAEQKEQIRRLELGFHGM